MVVVGLRLARLRLILWAWTHWLTWGLMCFSLLCSAFGMFGIGAVPIELNEPLFWVCWSLALIGAFVQTFGSILLNCQIWLVQPVWLQWIRVGLASLLVCAAIAFVATVGWHDKVAKWGVFFQVVAATLHFATYAHASEFPHRSHFSNFADSPPIGFFTSVCVRVFVCVCVFLCVDEKIPNGTSTCLCMHSVVVG